MRVVCAWCQHEMKPALLREVEPFDDPTETHGICEVHHGVVMRQLVEQGAEVADLALAGPGDPSVAGVHEADDRRGARDAVLLLQAWLADARRVLGERFGSVSDAVDAMEARCVEAEAERDRLERELARTQDALEALRTERHALEAMRREIARMASLLVERTIEESLQPLHALAARLRPGPTMRTFGEEVRGPVDSRDDSA